LVEEGEGEGRGEGVGAGGGQGEDGCGVKLNEPLLVVWSLEDVLGKAAVISFARLSDDPSITVHLVWSI
jgi:hypothetical protein